jgi:hypothetical protein
MGVEILGGANERCLVILDIDDFLRVARRVRVIALVISFSGEVARLLGLAD